MCFLLAFFYSIEETRKYYFMSTNSVHFPQKKLGNFWKSMILDEQSSMLRDASELGVSGLHDTAILAAILIQRPWYVNVPFATYFKSEFAYS